MLSLIIVEILLIIFIAEEVLQLQLAERFLVKKLGRIQTIVLNKNICKETSDQNDAKMLPSKHENQPLKINNRTSPLIQKEKNVSRIVKRKQLSKS